MSAVLHTIVPLAAMTPTEKNALIFGIISLAFGVLVLMAPQVLNYVVAFYLIIVGIAGILRAYLIEED
jgi:uncharacterized membrane protein HdeD (DUF308 family)